MADAKRIRNFLFDGITIARDLERVGATLGDDGGLVELAEETDATDATWYTEVALERAKRCARVYYRLHLFENSVRSLIDDVLREGVGDDWFEKCVDPATIKRSSRIHEAEGAARFHSSRGDEDLNYVGFPDLCTIITDNWEHFEELLYQKDWVIGKFNDLRLTRNSIAHMGDVSENDLQRLDLHLADWNQQVG